LHSSNLQRILQKQPDLEDLMRAPRMTAAQSSFGFSFARPRARVALALLGGLFCAGVPRSAGAHIKMSAPPDWITTNAEGDPQKITPCGVDSTVTYTPTNTVTTVHAGDKVTVSWTETVPHDGHFRISLAINSRSELLDPAVTKMNSDGTAAQVAISTSYPVLADDLFDHLASSVSPGKAYTTTVTIPNTPCAKCTLQLLQFMANHPLDPSYFYHQCADLTIIGSGGAPGSGGTAGSAGATGSGGAPGSGGSSGTSGSGGTTGTGGATASGGATGSGGATASGGATGSGGAVSSGGTTGSGGASASGGTTGSGGAKGSGGATGSGGSSGATGSGGSSGASGSGDSGSGGCSYAPGGAPAPAIGLGLLLVALTALRRGRRAPR
jgi:uncharacterized membrane protein YgcG